MGQLTQCFNIFQDAVVIYYFVVFDLTMYFYVSYLCKVSLFRYFQQIKQQCSMPWVKMGMRTNNNAKINVNDEVPGTNNKCK